MAIIPFVKIRINAPPKCWYFLLMFWCASSWAEVWYVDVSNTDGPYDGQTWETAYSAIAAAAFHSSDDPEPEIWVSAGVYGANKGSLSGSLVLGGNIRVYGGFTGVETSRDQRDWIANETVIDGMEARDGAQAYHVVRLGNTAELDGFTIQNGNANGESGNANGGGIFVTEGASPVIANCVIEENRAEGGGGAIFALGGGHIEITGCTIRNNFGRAVSVLGGTVSISDCVFVENTRGALLTWEVSPLEVSRCIFLGNSARDGGALFTQRSGGTFTNVVFARNRSEEEGGAVNFSGTLPGPFPGSETSLPAAFINCTFYANEAPTGPQFWGGADLTVLNCLFAGSDGEAAVVLAGPGSFEGAANLVPAGWMLTNREDENLPDTIHADAKLIAPSLDNFRLRPESPAVDAGAEAGAPDDDLEGTARPMGEGVDIGAYEFDPEAFVDPLDPSGDGMTNAVDVQMTINGALGAVCEPCDINGDGKTDAVDVQFIINAVLGNV